MRWPWLAALASYHAFTFVTEDIDAAPEDTENGFLFATEDTESATRDLTDTAYGFIEEVDTPPPSTPATPPPSTLPLLEEAECSFSSFSQCGMTDPFVLGILGSLVGLLCLCLIPAVAWKLELIQPLLNRRKGSWAQHKKYTYI